MAFALCKSIRKFNRISFKYLISVRNRCDSSVRVNVVGTRCLRVGPIGLRNASTSVTHEWLRKCKCTLLSGKWSIQQSEPTSLWRALINVGTEQRRLSVNQCRNRREEIRGERREKWRRCYIYSATDRQEMGKTTAEHCPSPDWTIKYAWQYWGSRTEQEQLPARNDWRNALN